MPTPEPADTRTAEEWTLDVTLMHKDGLPIDEPTAYALMDAVIDWAESRGLCVAGGIRPYEEEDDND